MARTGILAAAGVVLFHLCFWAAGRADGLWLPGLGVGLALIAWLGHGIAPVLFLDLIAVAWLHTPNFSLAAAATSALLLTLQLTLSWWCYAELAKGARGLGDPRSATTFLVLIPGLFTALAALLHALLWPAAEPAAYRDFLALASTLGLSRVLGILTVAPLLLVLATPWLQRWGCVAAPSASERILPPLERDDGWGESIELAGLAAGNIILTLALVTMQVQRGYPGWGLWGISLLLVVWTSLRQGLLGGVTVAGAGSLVGLVSATMVAASAADFAPLQGNLLAQCSTAVLVGASSGWIRAGEARYRRVVGHIPVILYSVRLPRAVLAQLPGPGPKSGDKLDANTGQTIVEQAEVTLVSAASQQIFGLGPARLEGPFTHWLERVHPADREIMVATLTQLCMQRQPVTCEYRIAPRGDDATPSNGGTPKATWVRDTLAPHHTSDGRLDGWDGVIEDITESRALAHTVRRTTAMLQALVANLPTGVFFVQGKHGLPVLVNARARQLLGQREDTAAGVLHMPKVYRLHKPDGSEYPADELPVAKALRTGAACSAGDIVVHRPDGRRTPLITWAAPVDLGIPGQPLAAVWVLEDLTAMQQAETARRESERWLRASVDSAKERYQHLVESLPVGVLQLDGQHKVTYCNPAIATLTGYVFADFQDPAITHKMLPPEDAARVLDALNQALVGTPARLEFRFFGKGGETRTGHVIIEPQQQGGVKGTTCILVDMTMQRRLEDELHKAQRLELMGKLASGTVHDFNNMLTALMGMAAIARGGVPADHPVHDDITRIIDIGIQASELAGQLLAFSKQRRLHRRPIDLNTVVVHTLKILKGVMPASIEITAELADGDLWVHADDTQLKQIVMNLCLNARDAMPDGGALRVVTARRPEDGKTWHTLAVHDTGEGMDDAVRARIFEPFFTTKERGSGLGLAVVQQILQRFGGRIDVHSQPGTGTTMEVALEACLPPAESEVVF